MFEYDDIRDVDESFLSQDSAVLEAIAKVDRGLFDSPEGKDEDLDALYDH
ncbi:MAG: hypothetical protein AAGK00_06170 [Pseudomonadota bacterium]